MVSRQKILAYARGVARSFQPEKILLFGSYAYGNPTEDSDVDILVIMRHEGNSSAKVKEIRLREEPGFPTDLIVRSPEVVERRARMRDFFIREILERGEVLYEADHPRMG